jgi:hypothetical protein
MITHAEVADSGMSLPSQVLQTERVSQALLRAGGPDAHNGSRPTNYLMKSDRFKRTESERSFLERSFLA